MNTEQPAPECLGKPKIADHPMIDLGRCDHRVGGAIHGYDVKACPNCGVTAHIGPMTFACGPRVKPIAPTAENCLGLKFKAEREARTS